MAEPAVRIAVTGHRGLPQSTVDLVAAELHRLLRDHAAHRPVIGVSCLADGADQIFAQAVLDVGGSLEVIVPAACYRDDLPATCWPSYDALFDRASVVSRLDHEESTADAHMDASTQMVDDAGLLVAVWDSQPARAYGGTADVVDYARRHAIPVIVVWPPGSRRD